MFIVIKPFIDSQDDNHAYGVGQEYPREGYKPSKERVLELAGVDNKAGYALIKEGKAGGKKAKAKKAAEEPAAEAPEAETVEAAEEAPAAEDGGEEASE